MPHSLAPQSAIGSDSMAPYGTTMHSEVPMDACAGCNRTGLNLLVCDDNLAPVDGAPSNMKQRFCAQCMIGKKVRVFWPLDEQWYVGVVQQYDPSTSEHLLQYPDGDTEWVKIGENTPQPGGGNDVGIASDPGEENMNHNNGMGGGGGASDVQPQQHSALPSSDLSQQPMMHQSTQHYGNEQQQTRHHMQRTQSRENLQPMDSNSIHSNRNEESGSPDKQRQHSSGAGGGHFGNEQHGHQGISSSGNWQQGQEQQSPVPNSVSSGGSGAAQSGMQMQRSAPSYGMAYHPPPHMNYGMGGPHPGMPHPSPYGSPYPPGGPYGPPPYGYPQHPHHMNMMGNSQGNKRNVNPIAPDGQSIGGQLNPSGTKRKSGPKTWTKEEDAILLNMVQSMRMPMKWSIVAQSMPERTGKQCRERYVNHLNPRLKSSEWSPQEDATIFHLYDTSGSQWAKMSKMIPGRTDNGIKNRFHNLRRQLEREDEHRLRLSKPKDFPDEIRQERLRDFPEYLRGKSHELWNMSSGIGVVAALSVLGGGTRGSAGRFGPFRTPQGLGEQCSRCGLFVPSVQCGTEICSRTKWCQACTRIPPHLSGNLLRECLNLRKCQDSAKANIIESWSAKPDDVESSAQETKNASADEVPSMNDTI